MTVSVYDGALDDLRRWGRVAWLAQRAARFGALTAVMLGVVDVGGYVAGSVWAAGSAPIVKWRTEYVRVVETIDQPGTTLGAPAVREQTHRLLIVGDSSVSLWQDEFARAVTERGAWNGTEIVEVVPLAEEGRLPCYFERFKPVPVQPGDVVVVSFVLTQWHRAESDDCRNSVAGAGEFYRMMESFARYVADAGGTVVPLALPEGSAGATSFTGEPWYPGMAPDEIEAWASAAWGAVVGVSCVTATVEGDDLFHVAPAGELPLGECVAAA